MLGPGAVFSIGDLFCMKRLLIRIEQYQPKSLVCLETGLFFQTIAGKELYLGASHDS